MGGGDGGRREEPLTVRMLGARMLVAGAVRDAVTPTTVSNQPTLASNSGRICGRIWVDKTKTELTQRLFT